MADQENLMLWTGGEATFNRVEDAYYDQRKMLGCYGRDDERLMYCLGVRCMRYPILMEEVRESGWGNADTRMANFRRREMIPIIGGLHHGSGPPDTNLLDPSFPGMVAAHMEAVVLRYLDFLRDLPGGAMFTPVNEPNTTARFSALYGHWYPHKKDIPSYLRALLHQVQGTRLAMKAIRKHLPNARLLQTEDFGRTTTDDPELQDQVSYNNQRSFLSIDLLIGRVNRDHPLWDHLLEHGIEAHELQELIDDPCPPDIIGVNYYVTSDRHLMLTGHHPASHPFAGEPSYDDVETVRVHGRNITGHTDILMDVHHRYGIPLVISEVQLACDDAGEDRRWLWEAWQGALKARELGATVIAVIAWAVMGSEDWDSLVTCVQGHYVPGAFDVRRTPGRVEATPLADLISTLATTQDLTPEELEFLNEPGWWRRPDRFLHGVERPSMLPGE